jgi:hypothetical protein
VRTWGGEWRSGGLHRGGRGGGGDLKERLGREMRASGDKARVKVEGEEGGEVDQTEAAGEVRNEML